MSDKPIRNFEVIPSPKAGLFGRLLGRVSREAVFVQVRNLLATTPFEKVRESDVTDILVKAKFLCRDATKELTLIFEHAALISVADGELSDIDRRGLSALQRAFELTDDEAATAIEGAVGQIFERTMRECLADSRFSEKEKATLEATSKALGMNENQTKRLYEAAAVAAVQSSFSAAVADRRYSANEEGHITALARALGVTITHDAATAALVTRFRLLAQVEAGDMPAIDVPILLRKGEQCHFSGLAGHHQIKTVTRRVNYGGPTASIKIMKGVRWRMGSIAVQRVSADVMTQLDTGTFYVTSSRILFDGAKKNSSIPLNKVTNFTVFKDGIQVEKESGPDHYFLGASDWELAGACLDAASNRLR